MFFRNMRQIEYICLLSDTPDFVSGFSFILSHDSMTQLVREEGFEPSSQKAGDFKSPVYTVPPLSHIMVGS